MKYYTKKAQKNNSQPAANSVSQSKNSSPVAQLSDNRPETIVQQKLQEVLLNSPQGVKQTMSHAAKPDISNLTAESAPIQRTLDTSSIDDHEVETALTMAKSLGVFQDVAANPNARVVVTLDTDSESDSYAQTGIIKQRDPLTYQIILFKQACTKQGAFRPGIAAYALQHEMDVHVLRSDVNGNRTASGDRRHPDVKDPLEHRKVITPWNVTISDHDFSIIRTGGHYTQRVVEQIQEGIKISSSYNDLYAYIITYCNDVFNTIAGMHVNQSSEGTPEPGYEGSLTRDEVWGAINMLGEVHNDLITACENKEPELEDDQQKLQRFREVAGAKIIQTKTNLKEFL